MKEFRGSPNNGIKDDGKKPSRLMSSDIREIVVGICQRKNVESEQLLVTDTYEQ